jgi:hypothetical protein
MKLRCSTEFLSGCASNGCGFRCSPHVLGVVRWTPGCSHGRLPGPTRKQAQVSSLELPPFFRVLRSPSGRLSHARPRSVAKSSAPPVRFLPLQRVPARGSGTMVTERPKLDRPTPSGFLDLLASSSAPDLLALFHARSAHGVSPSELCSSRAAARCLQRRYPLVVGASLGPVRAAVGRRKHRSAAPNQR